MWDLGGTSLGYLEEMAVSVRNQRDFFEGRLNAIREHAAHVELQRALDTYSDKQPWRSGRRQRGGFTHSWHVSASAAFPSPSLRLPSPLWLPLLLFPSPLAAAPPSAFGSSGCPPLKPIRPLAHRDDLGAELRRRGLKGIGVEIGVQTGKFTYKLLNGWQQAAAFVQVDIWNTTRTERHYHDMANVTDREQARYLQSASRTGQIMVQRGFAGAVLQCRGDRLHCSEDFPDLSLDFVYLDARHDRASVLQDLQTYWPKVRHGGIMAGHDYTEQNDVDAAMDPASTGQDWTRSPDGLKEDAGRAVKGAVEDFFSGEALESPDDIRRCPHQPVITYRELSFNTWMVAK